MAASSKLVLAIEMAKRDLIDQPHILERSLRIMDAAETVDKKIISILHEARIGLNTLYRIFGDDIGDAIEAIRNNHHLHNGLAHSVKLLAIADNENLGG